MITEDKKPKQIGGVGEKKLGGRQFRQGDRVYGTENVSPALTTHPGSTAGNSLLIADGRYINASPSFHRKPLREQSRTLKAAGGAGVITNSNGHDFIHTDKYGDVSVRRLTPRECFRLQGWSDEMFDRAAMVCSESQLYKQAGNGVTVNVIRAIGLKLKDDETNNDKPL